MADDEVLERSHEPSPKRIEDFRKKGQVPRSRDFNTMLLLMSGASVLLLTGKNIISTLGTMMSGFFTMRSVDLLSVDVIMAKLAESVLLVLTSLLPLLITLLLVSLLSPVLLGGWNFSIKAANFKGERISPLKGIKRMFSIRSLTELIKSLVKFSLILIIGVTILWMQFSKIINMSTLFVGPAIWKSLSIVSVSFLGLTSVLMIVAAVDVPYQLWEHNRKLKMTDKEVKDERKETEGNPEVKQRVRSVQRTMAQKRMMQEVPKASVVITNPTHYAVALRYDETSMTGAPTVVAKGMGPIAEQIRKIARENNVALYSAPPLARAIYHNAELGQEIPGGLYVAVAKILTYVYQLNAYNLGMGVRPEEINELPIPSELQYDEETQRV